MLIKAIALLKLEANHMDLMDMITQNAGEMKEKISYLSCMAATNMFTDEYDMEDCQMESYKLQKFQKVFLNENINTEGLCLYHSGRMEVTIREW